MLAWRSCRCFAVDARTTDRTTAGDAAISILVDTLSIGLMALPCTERTVDPLIGVFFLRSNQFDEKMSGIRTCFFPLDE